MASLHSIRLLLSMTAILVTVVFPYTASRDMFMGEAMNSGGRICQTELCSVCTKSRLVCVTNTSDASFLSELDSHMTYLSLEFKNTEAGSGILANITKETLSRFRWLEILQLKGRLLLSIQPGSFDHLTKLTELYIQNTAISTLPTALLKYCQHLRLLHLENNPLQSLPFDVVYTANHGFELKLVNEIITSIPLICEQNTNYAKFPVQHIGLYKNITSLSLVGIDIWFENCGDHASVSGELFAPFTSLLVLDVSNSNFFLSNMTRILAPLTQLQNLKASNIAPFKFCPASAKPFFESLAPTLRFAVFQYWESLEPFNESCVFNEEVLKPLGLWQLESLDFRFTDYGFGLQLNASIFPKMVNLKRLDLGFCGINNIYNFPELNTPTLEELYLDGNPLGSRRYEVERGSLHQVSPTLKKLSLAQTGIWSNDFVEYDLAPVLAGFPNLQSLNLSSNFLDRPPICNIIYLSTEPLLSELLLDDNTMRDTRTLLNNNQNSLCRRLPNLSKISLVTNDLRQVDGMCTQVRELYLADNYLDEDSKFASVVAELKSLKVLDLSANRLRNLPRFLDALSNLTDINLSKNHINQLPEDFFKNNLQLNKINLGYNFITTANVDMFQDLKSLKQLSLKKNLISKFPEDFLKYVEENLIYVYFDNCPIDCRCSRQYFQKWVKFTRKIPDGHILTLRCSTPSPHSGEYVYHYKEDIFECEIKLPLIIVCSILVAAVVATLFVLPCYKYSWYIRHIRVVSRAIREHLRNIRQEHVCEYDAYVSYNREDEEDSKWVASHLGPALEKYQPPHSDHFKPNLRLYIEHRDSGCVTAIFTEKVEALKKCNKILIVVSNSYLKSAYCLGEADLSGYEMYGTDFYQPNRVLVLVREELTEEIIKPPMTALLVGNVVQANTTSEKKIQAMWTSIRSFVSRPKYLYRKKTRENRQLPKRNNNVGTGEVFELNGDKSRP